MHRRFKSVLTWRRLRRQLRIFMLLPVISLLAGCLWLPFAVPPPKIVVDMPPGFPAERYAAGYAQGGQVFLLDPNQSEALIYVYRGGKLARFGHNHVIMSRNVQGYIFLAQDLSASRLDLFVPLDSLIVDDPLQRAAAGEEFSSKPNPDAIEGTRRNMLGERGLDAANHPFVVVNATVADGAPPHLQLDTTFTIHGITHSLPLRTLVTMENGKLIAAGEFTMRQSDFGIEPYSVLGGGLVVQDQVGIRYRLVAEAMEIKNEI